jgi:hypothetical protein
MYTMAQDSSYGFGAELFVGQIDINTPQDISFK